MKTTLLTVCALFAIGLCERPAQAALDEMLAKSAPDVTERAVANKMLRVRVRGAVTEFADEHGKVFAASWRAGVPNYKELLGSHYALYTEALRSRRPSDRNHFVVQTPELTLEVISIGRYIEGRVVLTQHIPAGVTIDALR